MIRRNRQYIQWIWAGIFSALFLARYASNQGEMVQPWEHWAIDSSLIGWSIKLAGLTGRLSAY